jgi:PAS domain S-box-containing protein
MGRLRLLTAGTDHSETTDPHSGRGVVAYVGLLLVAATAVAVAVADLPAPGTFNWLALPALAALLVAATWFVVPFRFGGSVDATNLVEAALAPLLVAFPPLVVVAVVAGSQIVNGLLRRLTWVKTGFNTAMWTIAAGLGAAVVSRISLTPPWPDAVLGMLAALAVIGLVNTAAFTGVMAVAGHEPGAPVARRLVPAGGLAALGGWAINAAFGLLFMLAYLASGVAAALFAVPLMVLHLAYRSYSAARADQARLVAVHAAAAHLSAPFRTLAAIPTFLRQVSGAFDAAAVELVIRNESGGLDIHRVDREGGGYTTRIETEQVPSLEGAIVAMPGAVHIRAGSSHAVARSLAAAGANDCLAAPLLQGERITGAILVLDRGGFAGSKEGELAILEALAREASSALAKGQLLADVVDERRKLARIVDGASDGILTMSDSGQVLTWNPALEQMTGLRAPDVLGRVDLASRLHMRTADNRPVVFAQQAPEALPQDIFITTTSGEARHLMCSYSGASADSDGAALVIVARDVTPAEEQEALREEVTRLVEVDAARRSVVEQLQHAVLPAPVVLDGAHVAATYEPSDPSEPTGGDLYDWLVLPSGEVHVAVVDVLGHGVAATKDALAVVHTLRVVTAAGTPLRSVVAQADALLRVQHPDLVATVIVARYDPSTGRLLVVSGGHPPALVVTPRKEVRQVAASGGVIGWPGAGSDDIAETVLEPGDALVLYTDGLVEARKNILDGIEELERHAADAASLPADEFADQLVVRALTGADRRDDTLALVLRRDFVSAPNERASWTIAPETAAVRDLRANLARWLAERGVERDDALIAAAELLSNAVRAAQTRVTLHVRLADAGIVLDVSDDGAAEVDIAQRGTSVPDMDAERGRGLFLVRAVGSHVDVLATAEGTTIRVTLPVTTRHQAETVGDGESIALRTR